MGFQVTTKLRIKFSGDYEGAEVGCRLVGFNMEQLFMFERLLELDEEKGAANKEDQWGRFIDEVIVDWNLEGEGGKAIPKSAASLNDIPRALLWSVLKGWHDKIVEFPAPLDPPSTNGSTSAVAETPQPANSS